MYFTNIKNRGDNVIKDVGNFCKDFRQNELNKTLNDLCEDTDIKIKTLSAFENGRANNIKYLFLYYHACVNDEQKKQFVRGFLVVSKGCE